MSRSTRRAALAAATVTTLALTAVACSSSDDGSSSGATASSSGSGTSAFQPQHKGGTLKLVAHAAAGSFDPQVNYTLQYWQLYQSMYDGLLAFKKVGGQQSFTVVPDLAAAMPKVTNGGKTYTFTLRKGITFSNGKPLTTDDVVASFQRIFKVSSPTAGTFYNGIVGADACLKKPADCTLSQGRHRRRGGEHRHHQPHRRRTRSSRTSWPCRTPASYRRTRRPRTRAPSRCRRPARTWRPRTTRTGR